MMKMYLCPEHERKLREAYWMSECSGSGECGVIGCAAAGREFDMRSKNYKPRRRPPDGPPKKDTRAKYIGQWRDF